MSQTARFSVVNPAGRLVQTVEAAPAQCTPVSLAKRLDTLDGKLVYLVDTGFGGSYRFMQQLQRWMSEHMPSVTTVRIPEGVDDKTVRGALLSRYGIEIGGGLGLFAGKAWRIGLMGYASQRANVMLVLSALGEVLRNERVDQGLAAAAAVYPQ